MPKIPASHKARIKTKTQARTTMNGFTVNVIMGKAGVISYTTKDGEEVNELRHPDDLFSTGTLESLMNVPYTGEHGNASLLTDGDSNIKTLGHVTNNVQQDGDEIRCLVKVYNGIEKSYFPKGKKHILAGAYKCDLIEESGVYKGVEYSKRQTNIIYDHVYRCKGVRGFDD